MSGRYLYVDVNATFTNPTRNLLPLAFLKAGDVRFFGPGHVSSDCLARGLTSFIEAEGPFDLVISNTLVLFSDSDDPARYASTLLSAYAYSGPNEDLLYLPIIAKQFASLSLPRIAILLENDFYNWTAREADKILASADYFIGFGEEFSPLRAELPHLAEERFAGIATDVWTKFSHQYRNRIASLLHFVSDVEFMISPLSSRALHWSVMGVQYHARGVARGCLNRAGIDPVTDTRLRKVVSLLKKTRLMRDEKRWVQKALNNSFAARMAATRYSYTCGSGLEMPIRKFFEIPAVGCLLVCRPFKGFKAAGFVDGVNCIIAEPDQLADLHFTLEAEPEHAEAIARAGQTFVLKRHSLDARAQDLKLILEAIVAKRFEGSYWRDGQHHLREPALRSVA